MEIPPASRPLQFADRHVASVSWGIELAFLLDDGQRLQPFYPGLDPHCADQLVQAVSRTPTDLTCHTRRIFHAYEQADGEALYGALLDLFLTLGGRGHSLRARLLAGVRNRLAPEHGQVLRQWLRTGRRPVELPFSPESVLSEGIEGEVELIGSRQESAAPARDPLQEARECIEYCQLDQARDLLERAVLEQPHRAELHEELLGIYRATHDRGRYQAMRERLAARLDLLPDGWAAQEAWLGGGEP